MMNVQEYIDNILEADCGYAISLLGEAIYEHPLQSEVILCAVGDHLIQISTPE